MKLKLSLPDLEVPIGLAGSTCTVVGLPAVRVIISIIVKRPPSV
ncbi:hypothetical protein [Pelomonas cellulosilytica]|nr:hypothetical protein [Pelomonas sp. P8]